MRVFQVKGILYWKTELAKAKSQGALIAETDTRAPSDRVVISNIGGR